MFLLSFFSSGSITSLVRFLKGIDSPRLTYKGGGGGGEGGKGSARLTYKGGGGGKGSARLTYKGGGGGEGGKGSGNREGKDNN